MSYILSRKIKVGISACNIGSKVRWNRAGWDRIKNLQREAQGFIWVPVCPEVNAGFGVPRPTIKLSGGNGQDVWSNNAKVKNRFGRDVTDQLKDGANISLEILKRSEVDAFVYMDGSPSCGVYRTTLRKVSRGKPPGVFGALLLQQQLFLIPALDLESPVKWWDWRRRLHAFIWLKDQDIVSKNELYEIWHAFKFMCQEVDRKQSDIIGNMLANMPTKLTNKFVENWKDQVLCLIRKPSNLGQIKSMLQKHLAFYVKHLQVTIGDQQDRDLRKNSHALVELVHNMEKRAMLKGIEFAGTPVIYRDKR